MSFLRFIKPGLLVFFMLFCMGISSGQKIERVEPTNWWMGMDNTQLQILIYGDNVSELQAFTSYPGVRITKTISVPNPNYLFVYLQIDKGAMPGILSIQLLKNSRR